MLRRLVTGLVALALLPVPAILTACGNGKPSPASSLKDFNLIVININTLRADHLKCYGYVRNTSPFLDSLAAQGVLYEHARSNSSYTRESVATLMSGQLPSHSGSTGYFAHPFQGDPDLGPLFRAAGYRTGFFTLSTVLDHPGFFDGFDEAEQLSKVWGASRVGPRLSERAIDFVRAAAGKKFALYLHYLDPHGPYDPPDDLLRKFVRSPSPFPLDVYIHVRSNLDLLLPEGFGPGNAMFEEMVARYDAEILDTDNAIRALFAGLASLGVLNKTLVVISADHGEEFLEHGFVEHAWTLYQEVLHVPLIFWAPGRLAPQRLATDVSVIDVLPTILALMEIAPPPDLDGTALFERDGRALRPASPPDPVISELLIPERSVLRTLVRDDWKYIAAQKWLTPSERPAAIELEEVLHQKGNTLQFNLWGPVIHEELYHLSEDPRELHDLSALQPERVAEFRAALEEYGRRVLGGPASRRPAEEPSPLDLEKLRSLGYVQ